MSDYYEMKIGDLENNLKEKDAEIKSLSENFGLLNIECLRLTAQLRVAVELVEMAADHSRMPHKHEDNQTRLYCLTERAVTALAKIDVIKKGDGIP